MDESNREKQEAGDSLPEQAGTSGPMGPMETLPPDARPAPRPEPVNIARSVGPMGSIDEVEGTGEAVPAVIESQPEPEVAIEPEMPAHPHVAEPAIVVAETVPTAEPVEEDVPIVTERESLLPAEEYAVAPAGDFVGDFVAEYASPSTPAAVDRAPLPIWIQIPIALLLAGFVFAAVRFHGWEMRKNLYLWSHDMHWGDAGNAFSLYGRGALHAGLFEVYSKIKSGELAGDMQKFDYPPLRAAIMARWSAWGEQEAPGQDVPLWRDAYSLTEPMLRMNFACEIVSAILVFILIRMWTLRSRGSHGPPHWLWPVVWFAVLESAAAGIYFYNGQVGDFWSWGFFYLGSIVLAQLLPGIAPALAGAMLFWFNPAVIWDAYSWPQWDVWIFPFMLGAILLASTEWWFGAGVLIAIGALLKGQLLLVAPIFLLWPLFRGQWKQAIHFVAGLALAFAVIIFPWMLPSTRAKVGIGLAAAGLALTTPFALNLKIKPLYAMIAAGVAILLAWPWGSDADYRIRCLMLCIIGMVALGHFVPRSLALSLYSIGLAATIFLMIPFYDASNAWYTQGYRYGSEKFMEIGTTVSGTGGTSSTNNLPVLLARVNQWPNDPKQAQIDLSWLNEYGLRWFKLSTVSVRDFMFYIYGTSLLLCGIGAAVHSRRGDPKVLACAVAPWLLSFVLLTQMNNRYLVWAAGMSALLPAVGLGMSLLGILVSVIGMIGMAQLQYTKFNVDPGMTQLIDPLSPHIGWTLTLAAAVYLYVAIVPGARSRRTSLIPRES